VRSHLTAQHGFALQCEGSVLYGLCSECAQKNAQAALRGEAKNAQDEPQKMVDIDQTQ
jgi:hypothetical protein